MSQDQRGLTQSSQVVGSRPCPGGSTDHVILDLTDDEARLAGLPPGQPVHVDRLRQPTTGDLVWVELVRHGSTQRLVRRYARDSGWVTLSAPGGGSAAVMRRQAELLVLGVVDDSASCATALPGG
jgi:hypothetical protein